MSSTVQAAADAAKAAASSAAAVVKAAVPSVAIPRGFAAGPNTPGAKTPADEGIAFFEGAPAALDKPIVVHELRLDPDGGPNKERAVSPLSLRAR
jgi:glycogen debranching enzyme